METLRNREYHAERENNLMMTRTAGVLLIVFIALAVAWGLTSDPVDQRPEQAVSTVAASERPAGPLDGLRCTNAGGASLPGALEESSGLAVDDRGRIWSHNDSGGDPVIYSVSAEGALQGRLTLQGASHVDWEDMDAGPCGDDRCLYVADIGDNDAERARVTIYRVAVPDSGVDAATAETVHYRYPDGPRDAEGLAILPDGRMIVVTKGRNAPIQVFQVEPETGTARLIRDLAPAPDRNRDRVTAATATPDGRWFGIRTNVELRVYDTAELLGEGPLPEPLTFDLQPFREPQGEGLAMGNDGTVWLSSEAGGDAPPGLIRLDCELSQR